MFAKQYMLLDVLAFWALWPSCLVFPSKQRQLLQHSHFSNKQYPRVRIQLKHTHSPWVPKCRTLGHILSNEQGLGVKVSFIHIKNDRRRPHSMFFCQQQNNMIHGKLFMHEGAIENAMTGSYSPPSLDA